MKIQFKIALIALICLVADVATVSAQQFSSSPRSSQARTVQRAVSPTGPTATRTAPAIQSPFLIDDVSQSRSRSVQPQVRSLPAYSPTMPTQQVPSFEQYAPAPSMGSYTIGDMTDQSMACDCGQPTCHRCRLRGRLGGAGGCSDCGTDCGCVECPRCDGDVCRLELDLSKKKKSCFKVEQETVCIPPVRFPWQTCPPATSKTRLVTRLKVHTFECPNCAYKWKLQLPETGSTGPTPAIVPADSKSNSNGQPNTILEGGADQVDENEVPKAPVLKGAFRKWTRNRR
ncbi:MAG: hypothetical protein AAFN77_04185 [Planctomycetota bacterium]